MSTSWYHNTRTDRPCWACQHFDGMTGQDTAALCNNPKCCRVRSMPLYGCSAWEPKREGDPRPEPPPEISLEP